MNAMAPVEGDATSEAADFAQRLLQIINTGDLTSTYKLALLLALMDVCMEGVAAEAPEPISVGELATKIVDLYWQQTVPYPYTGAVLQQSSNSGQARIVTLIRDFRVSAEHGQPITAAQAKIINANGYRRLVESVERQLYRYVLLKLQTIGSTSDPFIYDLPTGANPRREGTPAMFANGIHLKRGAAVQLIRFEPLLRPLIKQRWAHHVAGLKANTVLHHVYELEEFLFGVERVSLSPVANALSDLQADRCFYCQHKVRANRHVDHFIPWSRYRDNGLDNLVFTHASCNEDKRAYLAGPEHLNVWLERFRPKSKIAEQLAEISTRLKWERGPSRTYGAARTAYIYSSPATMVWSHELGLHLLDREIMQRMLGTMDSVLSLTAGRTSLRVPASRQSTPTDR